MKQFEYKVIAPAVNLALTTRQYEQQAQELEKLLNTLGAEGLGTGDRKRMDSTSSSGRNPLLRNTQK